MALALPASKLSSAEVDVWLLVAFVGQRYCGWQSQTSAATGRAPAAQRRRGVEDVLSEALGGVPLTSASRTDADVHARELLVRARLPSGAVADGPASSDAPPSSPSPPPSSAPAPPRADAALQLQARVNAALPADVRVRRVRLCRPSQIHMRSLGARKQYSYYVRTGGFLATAARGARGATSYEAARVDATRVAAALGPAAGAPHNFSPFAAAKRGHAGAPAKGDRDSVRTIERIAVSLLRPSECRFGGVGGGGGGSGSEDPSSASEWDGDCADDDAGIAISSEPGAAPVVLNAGAGDRGRGAGAADLPMKRRKGQSDEGGNAGGGGGDGAAVGDSTLDSDEPSILRLRFVGAGFLRHMIRRLVGAALAVGRGALPVTYIRDALLAADERLEASAELGRLPDGAAHDYAVAHGRGLWLERTVVPADFWTDADFSTTSLAADEGAGTADEGDG